MVLNTITEDIPLLREYCRNILRGHEALGQESVDIPKEGLEIEDGGMKFS
jgi:hypothetical protein